MNDDNVQFDDFGLKRAVQRAWGDERVPQRLRARVSHLLTTAGSIDDAPAYAARVASTWERWSGRVYGFAAAAIVVLSVALLVLYYQGTLDPALARYAGAGMGMEGAPVMPTRTQVPVSLARSMLATHGACGKLHDHRFIKDLGEKSYAALNVQLTADLGFPALARPIGHDWTFTGAGECNVGELRGSHLMFARGAQSISVFSLPSSCMSGVAPGAQFEGVVDEQPVAGFARSGAVYAVVGSGGRGNAGAGEALSLEAVGAIRDGLLAAFEPGCMESPDDLFFE